MRQWREERPLMIERAESVFLIDTDGNRYIDGVSSLWCNVHGHRVSEIDAAIRAQLDRVAHSTLLGLSSPPSVELAARLAAVTPGQLDRVFYSDAGATALEVAFKMAVGYWYQVGRPEKNRFIAMAGGYHGDTTGSMSVGFSELFHRPFASMVFETTFAPVPDPCRPPAEFAGTSPASGWPSEDVALGAALRDACLERLEGILREQAGKTAAIVIEPLVQGASGMVCQPEGFLRGVAERARDHDVLLIADEVAVGFGRTGRLFACEHEGVEPDVMCLAKGLTGGYLPLAATLTTDRIEAAFCGDYAERRTLYHGHTFTGNALGCAAALASLELFEKNDLLTHVGESARIIHQGLAALRDCPHVLDVRQRGVMVGIELCRDRATREPFDFSRRTGAAVCQAMRKEGVIVRPLGDVVILMPAPAMPHEVLRRLLEVVVTTIADWKY
jgi:adenosylmethionine-8-amino-7-oxononanoate aminotransferase